MYAMGTHCLLVPVCPHADMLKGQENDQRYAATQIMSWVLSAFQTSAETVHCNTHMPLQLVTACSTDIGSAGGQQPGVFALMLVDSTRYRDCHLHSTRRPNCAPQQPAPRRDPWGAGWRY